MAQDAALTEGAPYLLALLGTYAAERSLYTVALLGLPTALVYYAC